MSNRIQDLFQEKRKDILSIFYTAGYPTIDSTLVIARALEESGVDLIEIGIPFSDSLVDGPTIQVANEQALAAGMSIKLLFEQLADLRKTVSIPVVLMGCVNPVIQYGVEEFCKEAAKVGVDGVLLPDLPPEQFETEYKSIFDAANLSHVFLVTKHTENDRIKYLDSLSQGFLYAVSSEATTGGLLDSDSEREEFLARLAGLDLQNPVMLGFGIQSKETFEYACKHAQGGIIGSAFLRALEGNADIESAAKNFIGAIR